MNTPDSQRIVSRFFTALDMLISSNAIRGKKTFCSLYNIDRRCFSKLSKNLGSNIFQVAWLTYLVRDFGISADWLLLGRGGIYRHSDNEIVEQSLNAELSEI